MFLKINDIEELSDEDMTMTVHLHITLKWLELRLEVPEESTIWDETEAEFLSLDQVN